MADIAVTTWGDLALDPDGDVLILEDLQALARQSMILTLYTNAPDFDVFPDFGANLEDLIGRFLDEDTIDLAYQLIEDAVPDIENVSIVPDQARNTMSVVMIHPAFEHPVVLVFSLDEGLLVGTDAENVIYEAFGEV